MQKAETKKKREKKWLIIINYHGRKRLKGHGGDEVEARVLDRGREEGVWVYYYVPSHT